MPETQAERDRELQEAEDAKAAHAKFLEDKASGVLPEDADDPEPETDNG